MLRSGKIATVVLFVLMVQTACTNKTSAGGPGESASAQSQSEASLGKATFSAVIDGTAVSGGAIDGLQQSNVAHLVPQDDGSASTLRLWLFDTKTPDDQNFKHSLRIEVPGKVGANEKTHLSTHIILSQDHSGSYYSENASVTILTLTATRVTGTFSGKFRNSPDTPNVKPEITVTDGKFDVPMATNKLYPM
jgi:hypothetical protein